MSEDRLQEARNMNDMNLTTKQVDIFEWLISELEKCRAKVEKQRRHRKWALKEMKIWKAAANSINEDCTYNYKQSEKFKKRVGELIDETL